MRRAEMVLVGLLAFCSCGGKGVTIYAPPQLAEGTIFIDGHPAGHFQKTQREYRWLGWTKMKQELSAPARSETIARLPVVAPGKHELRIEKSGYEPILTTFNYSSGRVEVEIDDEQVKTSAPAAAR